MVVSGKNAIFARKKPLEHSTMKEAKGKYLNPMADVTFKIPAELLENPETSKALKILEKSAYNEAELRAYEYYWDAVYNERGAIRHGYKQGHAEGRAEGVEETKRENARRMKAKGYPVEDIAEITGLTAETINSL